MEADAAFAARAPPSPASEQALAAYLGNSPSPAPFGYPAPRSFTESTPQSSTQYGGSSSGGKTLSYDADSDSDEAEGSLDSRRRFAPAVRTRPSSGQRAEHEQISIGSTSTAATLLVQPQPVSGGSLAQSASAASLDSMLRTPHRRRTRSFGASRKGGGSSSSGSLSQAASSISLAHLLALPAVPAARKESAALVAVSAAAGAANGTPAATGSVQRRLSDIHSGHFISLHKLQRQCGDLTEPPADLMALMARRVFVGRSPSLVQRLEGEQEQHQQEEKEEEQCKEDALYHDALSEQEHSGDASPPASPPPPSAAIASPPEAPAMPQPEQGLTFVQLPQLPPIRTRVDKRRQAGSGQRIWRP